MRVTPDSLDQAVKRIFEQVTADSYGPWAAGIIGTVNIVGAGSGGSSQASDTGFVRGVGALTVAGGYYGPGGAAVGSGQVSALRLDASGMLLANLPATVFAVVNTSAAGTGYQVVNVQQSVNVVNSLNVLAGITGTLNAQVNTLQSVNIVNSLNVLAGITGTVFAQVNTLGTIQVLNLPVDTTYSALLSRLVLLPFAGLTHTSAPIQLNGSGVVAGNVLASAAGRIAVLGYDLVSAGTVYLSWFDGTINAPLTGSYSLIPNSGLVRGITQFPIMATSSGRGLAIGLSASCNVAGIVQYYVPV